MKLLERKHLLFLPLVIFSFVSVTAQTQEVGILGYQCDLTPGAE